MEIYFIRTIIQLGEYYTESIHNYEYIYIMLSLYFIYTLEF